MNKLAKCRHGDFLYQGNDEYIGKSLELYGEYNEAEASFFQRVVQPGHIVLDVGANIGSHTIPFAQAVGSQGRVLAFEPQRIGYYTLCANVVLNNLFNTTCYQEALDQQEGWLTVPDLDYSKVQNFGGLDLTRIPPNLAGHRTRVRTIDSLQLLRCNFIKIDVETMEKRVLLGGVDTIRKYRPMLYVEDDTASLSPELHSVIDSLGYRMFTHLPPLFNPNNFKVNSENIFGGIVSKNLFCHPKETPPCINPVEYQMVPVSVGSEGFTAMG